MAKVKCEPAFTQFDKVNVREPRKLTVDGAEVETINPDHFTTPVQASYDSPNSFSMTGNQTEGFQVGRRVQLDSGQSDLTCNKPIFDLTPDDVFTANKYDYSIISGVAFDGVTTDVTIVDNIVTTKLEEASVDINWSSSQAGLITTTDLINSSQGYPSDYVLETSGFTTSGDGGGAKWKQNGVIAQTPSQTPSQLGDALLNDSNGNQWAIDDSTKELRALGADPIGVVDSTGSIVAWLNSAGDLSAGPGIFLIDGAGPNAGGAYSDLVKNLNVNCSVDCTFKAGDLDNDMIRIEAPDTFAGDKVTVTWRGGKFDQRLQKNSTSIPFSSNYPPANPGISATTDALSIIGIYDNGGAKQAIGKTSISLVEFIATNDKWESAGGDSGINVAGEYDEVFDCKFTGNRDLGVYHSSDSLGGAGIGLSKGFKAYGNHFNNCMFGISSKRGADRVSVFGNDFFDCIQGIAIEPFNKRSNNVIISNNNIDGYIFGIDIASSDSGTCTGNTLTNAGVLLEGGATPVVNFTNPEAIRLNGSLDFTATGNTINGKIPEFGAYTCEGFVFIPQDLGGGPVDADNNMITSNIIKNIDTPFSASDLLNNSIEYNKVSGTNDDSWNMSQRVSKYRNNGELTISSGEITVTGTWHNIDTESSSATDDLDTINGGVDGMRLIIKANNSSRTVVVKDTTGNIQINSDFSMDNQADFMELIFDANTNFWYELGRSNNG